MNTISTDDHMGDYTLKFLRAKIEAGVISHAEIESVEGEDAGREALQELDYSFAWLRDDGVRILRAYDNSGELVPVYQLEDELGIDVSASKVESGESTFKTGKYVGRLMRPQPHSYGGDIDVFINTEMPEKYGERANDGLSIMSTEMADKLGLDMEAGQTGHLTGVFGFGLVKGHFVVREEIDHDLVIYGEENIKPEVKAEDSFVMAEAIGQTKTDIQIDVQTLFNLLPVFGREQVEGWAADGIQEAVANLFEGKLGEVLDLGEGEEFDPSEEIGDWPLAAAARRDVNITEYPRLLKRAWGQYSEQIDKYESGYRIPVPGSVRAYIRTCRRHMDGDGNYEPEVNEGEIFVGRKGSFYIHPSDAAEIHDRHGGSDEDDPFVFIPLQDGRTLAYRSPNQYGEVGVYNVNFAMDDVKREAELKQEPETLTHAEPDDGEADDAGDDRFDPSTQLDEADDPFASSGYSPMELELEHNNMCKGDVNIGTAANAGMVRADIRHRDPELADELQEKFAWNLETIIDAVNKNGVTPEAEAEFAKVHDFFAHLEDEEIAVSETAQERIPDNYDVPVADDAPMDVLMSSVGEMLSAAEEQVNEAIDQVRPKAFLRGLRDTELGGSKVEKKAREIRAGYGRIFAESGDVEPGTEEFDEVLSEARTYVTEELARFDEDARVAITAVWAYDIYADTEGSHKDSILWIPDQHATYTRGETEYKGEKLRDGTSRYMLQLLQHAGVATELAQQKLLPDAASRILDDVFGAREAEQGRVMKTGEASGELNPSISFVRVWTDEALPVAPATEAKVEGDQLHLTLENGVTRHLNLGDECDEVADGSYAVEDETALSDSSLNLGLVA